MAMAMAMTPMDMGIAPMAMAMATAPMAMAMATIGGTMGGTMGEVIGALELLVLGLALWWEDLGGFCWETFSSSWHDSV